MNPFEIHAAGLAALQTELATDCPSFAWKGQDWKCLPGGARRRKELGAGGFAMDADLQLTCLVAQFGVTAHVQREAMLNTPLVYQGTRFRVDSVTIAAGGLQLRINCMDAAQI
jgi:hypothetical protein